MDLDLGRDGYYWISADETRDIVFVPNDACPQLEFLQNLVGGMIERICVLGGKGPKADLIVNEEGRVFQKAPNTRASALYFERIKLPIVLVGDAVVLCGKARLT